MAPPKKRHATCFASSSAPPSSSAPSTSKRHKSTTTETHVVSSRFAVAIATASDELSSLIRSVSSPEDRGVTSSQLDGTILCSAGSVTRNCPVINIAAPMLARRVSTLNERWEDGAHSIPRFVNFPHTRAVDAIAPSASFSTSSEYGHRRETMHMTRPARGSRVTIPLLPFRDDGIANRGSGDSTASTLSSYEHGAHPPRALSRRFARPPTRPHEARLRIVVATTNGMDPAESYEGDRHPATGHRHGRGTTTYPNGCRYSGEFVNDMRQGHGKCWYPRDLGVYAGQWHENDKHGYGSMVYANDDVYNGMWHRNHHSGSGTLTMNGGAEVYSGDFANNKKHGLGVLTCDDGSVYRGTWSDDVRHGEGVLMLADGTSSRQVYYHGKLVYPFPRES